MRNIFLLIAIFSAVVLTTGCSDGKLKTIRVTGTVTQDGVPLDNAEVTFSPKVQGQGAPAFGLTNADGRYVLQTLAGHADAGTTPGEYYVYIIAMETVDSGGDYVHGAPQESAPPAPPKSRIHEAYTGGATSGFSATVSRGNTVFDFELKSAGP